MRLHTTIRRWGSFPFHGFGPNELCVLVNRLCLLYSVDEISLFGNSLVGKFGLQIYFSQGVVTPFPQLRQKNRNRNIGKQDLLESTSAPFFSSQEKSATQHNREG